MRRFLKIALLVLVLPSSLKGQYQYFNKLYDYQNNFEGFNSVCITPDSGFVSAGHLEKFGTGFFLHYQRTDKNGNVTWSRILDLGPGIETTASTIVQGSGNNFVIGGRYMESDSSGNRYNRDIYLVNINSEGDTLWTRRFSFVTGTPANPDFEDCLKLIRTSDNGFALTGYSSGFAGNYSQMFLIKTDSNGVLQWKKNYGGSEDEGGYDLLQLPDSSFFVFGYSDSYNGGVRSWYLVRTDKSGSQIWEKTYGGPIYNIGVSINTTLDNNLILTGGMAITSTDAQGTLLKTDLAGNVIWEKKYGGSKIDEINRLVETSNGDFVTAGSSDSYSASGYSDGWIAKFDSSGNKLWERIYDRGEDTLFKIDYLFDVKATYDGGYIFCGQSYTNAPEYQNAWLLKTDCLGCDSLICFFADSCDSGSQVNELINGSSFVLYPNPTSGDLKMNYSLQSPANFTIFDLFGREIYNQRLLPGRNDIQINILNVPGGIYLFTVAEKNKIISTGKLVFSNN